MKRTHNDGGCEPPSAGLRRKLVAYQTSESSVAMATHMTEKGGTLDATVSDDTMTRSNRKLAL